MIKNERQYRASRQAVRRFESALAGRPNKPPEGDRIHPLIWNAERETLESELERISAELTAYETLKTGGQQPLEVASWDDLPDALVRGRIAARLTQKELADRMGLAEQQIQRYEATRYSSASLRRVQEVAQAIGLSLVALLETRTPSATLTSLVASIGRLGFDIRWAFRRLLPSAIGAPLAEALAQRRDASDVLLHRAGEILARVCQTSRDDILSGLPRRIDVTNLATVRFKELSRANLTPGYLLYAHYLALLTIDTCASPRRQLPSTAADWIEAMAGRRRESRLTTALHALWDLGVPVLPLRDEGQFHGACWRTADGSTVVVLKQRSNSIDRWMFDLFHEVCHAVRGQDEPYAHVHLTPPDTLDEEEAEAMSFAGDVLLDGRAELLAETALHEADDGLVPRLKYTVPRVASREGVPVGVLANYIAFYISRKTQGKINWWGTAQKFQDTSGDPWTSARDVFLERANFHHLNEVDRELLIQALADPMV